MKLRQIIFFLAFLFSCLSLFAQQEGKEMYIDKINDFIIFYPDDWEIEQGEEGEITIFTPYGNANLEVDSDESQDNKTIEEKIQIIPSRWDEGELQEFVSSNFTDVNWNEIFDGFRIEKQGKEKINGKEAIWFMATYKVQDVQVTSLFYFIKMFNRVISFTSFCRTEDFELSYKIKYLEIIRSTRSNIEAEKSKKK